MHMVSYPSMNWRYDSRHIHTHTSGAVSETWRFKYFRASHPYVATFLIPQEITNSRVYHNLSLAVLILHHCTWQYYTVHRLTKDNNQPCSISGLVSRGLIFTVFIVLAGLSETVRVRKPWLRTTGQVRSKSWVKVFMLHQQKWHQGRPTFALALLSNDL